MVELFPDACRHCQHALPVRSRQVVGEPRRHQVTELPPIEAHITEYRCHRLVCPACGLMTQAPLPPDVEGQFGPQLTAGLPDPLSADAGLVHLTAANSLHRRRQVVASLTNP
jgi:hypothetical protein